MKLYYTPGACSLAPHIIAREAKLEIGYDRVDLRTQTTASGCCYGRINPKGSVPALVLDSGEVLTEVQTILEYIADQAPSARLLPEAGSPERHRVKEWLGFVATELHSGFGPFWDGRMPAAARRLAANRLHLSFLHLDQCLQGQTYLAGEQFTIADAYCFTILSWAHFHRIDLSKYENIDAFMRRISARSSVQSALQAEGLLKAA